MIFFKGDRKMVKTKVFTAIAILLLIFGGTGCNRQNVDKPVQGANSAPYVDYSGQHIQRQLDTNLSVDAEVVAPTNTQKLNTLLVTPIKLNTYVQTLETMLISKSKVTQKDNLVNGGSRFLTADGKELFVDNVTADFQTDKFRKYIYQLLFHYIDPAGYNFDRFSQKQDLDLPFMPHQQAIDEVKKDLTSLGISVYDKVETYSLDYQTLQAQEKIMKEKGDLTSPKNGSITLKDGWSKEDDCYFMMFRIGFDNIPAYSKDHGNIDANTFVPGTRLYACYSKKGLEYLSITDPYEKKAVDQEGLKIISSQEALAAVKRKYGNVILTSPTIITAIELNYVRTLINQSRDKFRMVPAWCFKLKVVQKDGNGSQPTAFSTVIIDATTGGEIL
jgi:hypothetical protein